MIDTHYMYRPPTLDAEMFKAFISDVRRILAAAPTDLRLRGFHGHGPLTVRDNQVVLNGDASGGGICEPLVIEQVFSQKPPDRMKDGVHFDFCKTNGRPYDLVVVAILYAFKFRFPGCKYVSDSKLEELKPGFDLFVEACSPQGDVDQLYRSPREDR